MASLSELIDQGQTLSDFLSAGFTLDEIKTYFNIKF